MTEQCRTCGERGKDGLSLLEPENASLLQFIIIHLQLAGHSFFVCHACVVEIKHWKHFLTRFQTSQTHFQQVLATSKQHPDSPQQTTDVEPSLESILPKCRVLVTKLLECDSCSFCTDSKAELATHVQTHLEPNTSDLRGSRRSSAANQGRISLKHQCAHCGTKFAYPEVLVWHTANCHGKNSVLRVENINNQKHKHHCSFCKSVFNRQDLAIWHLLREHKFSNLPFRCTICDKQFVNSTVMKAHQMTCTSQLAVNRAITFDHKCDECGIKYAHPEILKWHTANCHGNDAIVKIIKKGNNRQHQFQCILCEAVFENLDGILRHLRAYHNLVNSPFGCKNCDRMFTRKWDLKIHHLNKKKCMDNKAVDCNFSPAKHNVQLNPPNKNVETTENSGVECELCNKDFLSEKELKTHISKFHPNKEFCFECQHCEELFCSCRQLFSHCRTNHPEKHVLHCDICSVGFVSFPGYMNHKKYKHSGREFTCNICSATFISPSTLSIHLRRQHSEESFSCKFCNVKFKCNEYLQRHVHNLHTGAILQCEHCTYNTRRKFDINHHIRHCHFK